MQEPTGVSGSGVTSGAGRPYLHMTSTSIVLAASLLVGCMKLGGSTGGPSVTQPTTAPSSKSPFAGNQADAPVHAAPTTIVYDAPCAEATYARIDAKGQAFSVEVSVSAGCVMVGGLDDDGSVVADGIEVCADKPDGPHVLQMTAQPGRPMLTANERGNCVGSKVTLVVKPAG